MGKKWGAIPPVFVWSNKPPFPSAPSPILRRADRDFWEDRLSGRKLNMHIKAVLPDIHKMYSWSTDQSNIETFL